MKAYNTDNSNEPLKLTDSNPNKGVSYPIKSDENICTSRRSLAIIPAPTGSKSFTHHLCNINSFLKPFQLDYDHQLSFKSNLSRLKGEPSSELRRLWYLAIYFLVSLYFIGVCNTISEKRVLQSMDYGVLPDTGFRWFKNFTLDFLYGTQNCKKEAFSPRFEASEVSLVVLNAFRQKFETRARSQNVKMLFRPLFIFRVFLRHINMKVPLFYMII